MCVVATARSFALGWVDRFPALVKGEEAVPGELYEVDAVLLARLDEFEGVEYRRVKIQLEDGSEAFAYLLAEGADAAPSA